MNDRFRLPSQVLVPVLALLASGVTLIAHPMGNFSINHYALIMPGARSVEVLYVLDIAELPTFQLLQQWNLTKDSPRADFEAKARAQAAEWLRGLKFTANGNPVQARLERVDYVMQDGAGGLPVMRINSHLQIAGQPGSFAYEDTNFADRAGWKEIVIEARPGTTVSHAEPPGQDRTRALTAYPQDPTVAPPQDLVARFDYAPPAPHVTETSPPAMIAPAPANPAPPVSANAAVPQKTPAPLVATGAAPAEPDSLGTVKRDDFLSRTLKNSKDSLPWGLALICVAAAFGVGALHAIEPGHGKTMVAAYLVGSRGTFRQAIFLGGMVTFTHTISVFALGLVTLFLSQYLLPETLVRLMGVISGVSIIWIGGLLLYRRGRKLFAHETGQSHQHVHGHSHAHAHPHAHDHEHSHAHGHDHVHHHHDHDHALTHTHDGHTHSHIPEGEVTVGSLVALGVSGGLVPCPAALVLLLSCMSIGRPGLGLVLLISFSIGLALVLMLIGVIVLVVKKSVPKSNKPSHIAAWGRYAPVFSAALIFAIGVYMTGVAVGAFPVVRLIG